MFDIHQTVVDEEAGELDHDLMRQYIEGLLDGFHKSPEFMALPTEVGNGGYSAIFLEYFFDYVGGYLPDLSEEDAREVLFEIFPRKLSTEPSSAAIIVPELRALFSYLDREYGLRHAKRVVALLNADAERQLRVELANPANYGMAKSLFMMAKEEGYDMTTQAGCEAFRLAYNERILSARVPANPPATPSPPVPPFFSDRPPIVIGDFGPPFGFGPSFKSRAEQDQRRKARKEKRKARKRNRR
jgi:hypothetical protein